MIIVNTHEAKTQLSQLLAKVEQNKETIYICRNGKPVAEIIPIAKHQNPLTQDRQLRDVTINYDPTEPLSDDEWPDK